MCQLFETMSQTITMVSRDKCLVSLRIHFLIIKKACSNIS